ncbi:MAG: hypothetical protein JNL21_39175 [Myxococcales bacterium]|nr:hypothetical protein [Myxococcales bacterium]
MRSHLGRTLAASSVIVGLLGAAAPALANGRFPNADHLVVDPGNPDHIVVRATFGLVQSFDAGASWTWICEPAVGYGGTDDPAIAVTGLGHLLVGIRDGVATSTDAGCSFAVDGSALAALRVVDLAVEPLDPAAAVGISGDDADGNPRIVVAETLDDGLSWTALGPDLDTDLFPQTIDAAPSMRERIYVSAVAGVDAAPVIERSSDRGATWTRVAVDIPGAERTFISAISPVDPDRIYLRVPGEGTDRLFVSDDAAETWTEILSLEGEMLGFGLSPDGEKVAVGLKQGGVYLASTSDHRFVRTGESGVRCLTWAQAGLYACGNQAQDGFTVGLSTDEGASFTPLYDLLEIGLSSCPAGTDTAVACPPLFEELLDQLGGSGGSGAGGATAATVSSASTGGATPEEAGDGCSCRSASRTSDAPLGLVALAGLLMVFRSRNKRFEFFEGSGG